MTINELIKALQRLENKEKEVSILLDEQTTNVVENGCELRVVGVIEKRDNMLTLSVKNGRE